MTLWGYKGHLPFQGVNLNKKLILAVVVIAVIAIAAYILFFQNTLDSLKTTWKSIGIQSEYLHSNPEKVAVLDSDNLSELKNSLSKYINSSDSQTKQLAGVYINYVDYVLKTKNADNLAATLSINNKTFCENISDYKKLVNLKQDAYSDIKKMNEKIRAFNSQFPDKSAEIALFASIDSEMQSKQNLGDISAAVQNFSKDCGGLT